MTSAPARSWRVRRHATQGAPTSGWPLLTSSRCGLTSPGTTTSPRRSASTGPTEGRLTPGEIGLLAALARRPGAVLTRDQLLEAVTRRPDEVYDRVVDVHVANLRRKLGDDAAQPWLIETIPQTGYRLVAAPDAA